MKHSYQEQADIKLDQYISRHVQYSRPVSMSIRPPHDFTERVITQARQLEQRRSWLIRIGIGFWAVGPITLRELWMLMRADYFSLSSFPMGDWLVRSYGAVLSPLAMYLLIASGVGTAASYYLVRNKRMHTA